MAQRFTDEELRSLAVNAMGRGSEAGSLPVMRLGLATNTQHGIVHFGPNNNSGYTVGFFQWDFGQKDAASARQMVEGYNAIAPANERIANVDEATRLLRLHGGSQNGGMALEGHQDLRTTELGKKLNGFLATDQGYAYVMRLQERQFEEDLKPAMKMAAQSPAVQHMNDDDARIVIASIAKVKNQTGSVNHKISEALNNPHASAENILQSIYSSSNQWVDQGVGHTVEGAKFFNAISKDNGVVGQMFKEQLQHNPMHISDFKNNPQEQLLDAMFRNPHAGLKMLEAANEGKEYRIKAGSHIENEAFTVGVDKAGHIYTQDKHGHGFIMQNGHWQENNVQIHAAQGRSNDAQIPEHYAALHQSVHGHISRLYNERGIDWANGGDNTVAKCTVDCADKSMTAVDQSNVQNGQIILAQKDGFVWNNVSVDATQAARTPAQESLEKLAAVEPQKTQQPDNPTQTQERSGPKMG